MKRAPLVLPFALIAIWLLLNNTLGVAQFLLGIFLAVLLTLAVASLRPIRPRLRRMYLGAPLAISLLVDILGSNIAVARIVLGGVRKREVRAGFLDIPLELKDPHALAILAMIVTSTPGTTWAGVSEDGRTLTLHFLDLHDEAKWIRSFKARYERRLMRMFE